MLPTALLPLEITLSVPRSTPPAALFYILKLKVTGSLCFATAKQSSPALEHSECEPQK